jgi:hypothetical protein
MSGRTATGYPRVMLLAGSLSTRLRFAPFAMLMLCVMSATPGRAVSVIPPEFADLVTEATQIVRVRVTEISVRWTFRPRTGDSHLCPCADAHDAQGDPGNPRSMFVCSADKLARFRCRWLICRHSRLGGRTFFSYRETIAPLSAGGGDAWQLSARGGFDDGDGARGAQQSSTALFG